MIIKYGSAHDISKSKNCVILLTIFDQTLFLLPCNKGTNFYVYFTSARYLGPLIIKTNLKAQITNE